MWRVVFHCLCNFPLFLLHFYQILFDTTVDYKKAAVEFWRAKKAQVKLHAYKVCFVLR